MAVTYQDIPENLRRAACEAVKLRRAGKPVPDDIQEMSSRYKRWIYHGGQDPGEGDGRGARPRVHSGRSARGTRCSLPEAVQRPDSDQGGDRHV